MKGGGGFLLIALVVSGCASNGAVPRPFPLPESGRGDRPDAAAGAPPPVARGTAPVGTLLEGEAVLETALTLRGIPYRAGGGDPRGFDCSGLVQYVFARHGVALPRNTSEQFLAGIAVTPDELEPGDLVFFATVSAGASHVGIALDGERFVHAPTSNGVVRIDHLESGYWARRFLGARRIR